MSDAVLIPLGEHADLAEGQARGLDPLGQGRDSVFLVRVNGQLRAWRDDCPHQPGAPMAWRRHAYLSANGRQIVCHAHGARFDPDTGRCVLGPALGQSLQPVPLIDNTQGERCLLLRPQETTT